jgi:hypothetical protein
MVSVKAFGILVEARGRGGAREARLDRVKSGDRVNPVDRKGKTPETHANLGWVGMTANKSFGILVRVDGGKGVGARKRA